MTDFIWQMVSITCVGATILFCWDQLCAMRYSFWNILVRAIFYKDMKPMDWLIENLEYIFFLMILIGHAFSILGLLQQLANNSFHTKSHFFYASSPINNIGMIGAFTIVMNKYYRRVFNIQN